MPVKIVIDDIFFKSYTTFRYPGTLIIVLLASILNSAEIPPILDQYL